MEEALYGTNGFYSRGSGAGTRRDFLTSPEVGSLFGAVVARRLDAEWDVLGRPDHFTVVELGPGPGTLARTVGVAGLECASCLDYVLVDRAPGMRSLHESIPLPQFARSSDRLPGQPFSGVIFGNEVLDNIPTRLCTYVQGQWFDLYVDADLDIRRSETDASAVTTLERLCPQPQDGQVVPLQQAAAALVRELLELLSFGSLVLLDYARLGTTEFAETPNDQWIRSYRQHQRTPAFPLAPSGSSDITVDVAIDQLPTPSLVSSQSDALHAWGLTDVLEHSALRWERRLSDWNLDALRAKSHASEAAILTDPHGLGGFTVLEWHRR
jgi:SAM-dependent MidA family methyltransferase